MTRDERERRCFECVELMRQDMGDTPEFRQIVRLEWAYWVVASYRHEKAPDNCLRQLPGRGQ